MRISWTIMIIGVGIDAVKCNRLEAFHHRHGERGLRRLFTPGELTYCLGLAFPAPSLAARFAAKEAFFKALGTGWGIGGRWTDVEVLREASGRPSLMLYGRARTLASDLGARHAHLSLSHTDDLALAQVMLEA